jgi:hypothetical protein
MSLPSPTATPLTMSYNTISEKEMKEWDAPLAMLAQKSKGDLRQLMYAFFSFLHRRTDFYVIRPTSGTGSSIGFQEGEAEQILLAAFRQFPLVKISSGSSSASSAKQSGEGVQSSGTCGKPECSTTNSSTEPGTRMMKQRVDEGRKVEDDAAKSNTREEETHLRISSVRRTEEGKQIPVGNGGCTERYQWTQSVSETTVITRIPKGLRAKDLHVIIRPTSVSVQLKEPTAAATLASSFLLEGDLVERIRPEESTWTIESNALLLTLEKVKKTWWAAVFVGDDEIDTHLIDSTRKISDYDESTQGALRKIMFDQNQQRLGLPTSDEILGKGLPSSSIVPCSASLPPGVEYIDSETLKRNK